MTNNKLKWELHEIEQVPKIYVFSTMMDTSQTDEALEVISWCEEQFGSVNTAAIEMTKELVENKGWNYTLDVAHPSDWQSDWCYFCEESSGIVFSQSAIMIALKKVSDTAMFKIKWF